MGKRDVQRFGSLVVCNGVEYDVEDWKKFSKERQQELIHRPALGLPIHYQSARFEDFPDTDGFRNALPILQRFAMNHDRGAGIYLHGPVGVGKTHLIAATMAELRLQGGDHQWMTEDNFFVEIWGRQSSNSERGFYRDLISEDVLVFDDLFSAVRWNDWKAEQLDRLVRLLYDSRTVMVASSNIPPRDIAGLGVLSGRALSRLKEMVVPIEIEGPDLRTKPRRPLPKSAP